MRYFLMLLSLLALAGCGGEQPYTDNSRDPAAYAKDVKHLVLESVEIAKKSSEPADQILTIVTELKQSGERPVGEHKATYDQLLEKANALLSACQSASNGKPANLTQSLEELAQIAQTLPGEVVINLGH
jgi:hypothetical protein